MPKLKIFSPYTLKDVNKSSNRSLFTVVTTFAGGGGSSTGYKLAGGKILFANEFIPSAIDTYKSNYPNTKVSGVDIRFVNRRKKVKEWFNSFNVNIGEYDILDGSPPCSTFSTSGKGKIKIEAKNVKYSDTTQDRIGMLIHDFVYLVNKTRPKTFIIENVPTIKSSLVFSHAIERLKRYGYLVNFKILKSSKYGVPQSRRRIFVLGVRPDIAKKAGLKNSKDLLDVFPEGSAFEYSIRDALNGLMIDKKERNTLLSSCRRSSSYELIKNIPFNPIKKMGVKDINPKWTSDFNLVRPSWDLPCPTLTQMGQQMGRGGIYHPNENRVFTITELKRLMGLPDDYKLTGDFNKKAERIGRMVPPLMTKALAESVYTNILSKL